MKKQRALMTAPLRGYLSKEAKDIIERLEKMGFDPDLAFAFAESGIPEEDFYDLPPLTEDTEDGHE